MSALHSQLTPFSEFLISSIQPLAAHLLLCYAWSWAVGVLGVWTRGLMRAESRFLRSSLPMMTAEICTFFLPLLHNVEISVCSSSVYKLWCVWEGGCGGDWYLEQSNDMGLHLSHGSWGNLESKTDLGWQHFFYLFELQSYPLPPS